MPLLPELKEEINNDKFYKPAYKIGRAGIERFYEEEFRGNKGVKYIVTSARQNTVGSFEDGEYDTTAVQADGIVLGLDIELQAYGEKLMQNKKRSISREDVANLCLASLLLHQPGKTKLALDCITQKRSNDDVTPVPSAIDALSHFIKQGKVYNY